MKSILLSDLIDEFGAMMAANGYSKNTQRNALYASRRFLAHVGNIQVRNVTSRHVDGYFASRQVQGMAPSTLNTQLAYLRMLFKHATVRSHISGPDPLAHRRQFRTQKSVRRRIPASDFPRLLDATQHPRDRIILALGIYLLLRQSEIKALKVGDVDLHHGVVSVQVIKSDKADEMPISSELDTELRRWFAWYAEKCGGLDPSWCLTPAKGRPFIRGFKGPQDDVALDPSRPMAQPQQIVQRAMRELGLATRGEDGASLYEGVHTLRRSAARALFDRLVDDGYDGALRVVQSSLHHSNSKQTEVYLGIELDAKRRDELIRGEAMFPVDETNVVRMEAVRGNA